MNATSWIGLILGLAAVALGHVFEGGHLGAITQGTAAWIVVGGTLGATLLGVPREELRLAARRFGDVFRPVRLPMDAVYQRLGELATAARKDGLVVLDQEADRAPDPFLRVALHHVVDGMDAAQLREVLETEITLREEREVAAARVFETAGGLAPTLGILGAVLGLIHTLGSIEDPQKVSAGIAVAFVATLYGVGLANLLLLPVANQLRRRAARRRRLDEMILDGALILQAGHTVRILESRLAAFLEADDPAPSRR